MEFTPLAIADVVLIKPQVFGDDRGFFLETFRQQSFEQHCGPYHFVQDNHSKSRQGILRGLHYQFQQPQGKLVWVTAGAVFDVVVDMRAGSPTQGQWLSTELTADNKQLLWVPPGFAHGFYVLSEAAEFVYKCTRYYAPEYEVSLLWNDSTLAIDWPLVDGAPPQLSEKDRRGLSLATAPLVTL